MFEQEKKLLQSQNEWLNSELNSKSEILLKLQKDRVSYVMLTFYCLLYTQVRQKGLFYLLLTLGTTSISVRE